ncbi:MAG: filamentous hemagglutinin N-terminal domain-containing protein [Methylococcales bacterium]|jgi:filamentous hemagglutinin family protein|nr:filamentous hemagglutinin N-terminal domain-containing protein [Methylococcales bacterium]
MTTPLTAFALKRFVQQARSRPVLTIGMCVLPQIASADLTNAQIISGDATINQVGNITTITQTSDKLVLNFDQFNIGSSETVQFIQPSSSAIALNRVTGGSQTNIFGNLFANGQVFLVNVSGVFIAASAKIDVAGIVATTLDITNQDFLNGNMQFQRVAGFEPGKVTNEGLIQAKEHGYVVLAGDFVENKGVVVAKLGTVGLASAEKIMMDFQGDGLIQFAVDGDALGELAGVSNQGQILAQAGRVIMTADVAADLSASAVQNSGIISAKSITERNGEIFLSADGDVQNSGSLDVSGDETANGGVIHVLGERVALTGSAELNASGLNGGEIRVGGDFFGAGSLQAADITHVGSDVQLLANALGAGGGGSVVVWADQSTEFLGSISAKGGALAGSGGSAEVSGKVSLSFKGEVDLSADNGQAGALLLDPLNITVQSGGVDDLVGGVADDGLANVFSFAEDPGVSSQVDAALIESILTSGTDVTLEATNDIIVNQDISNADGGGLTLRADNNITINNAVTLTGAGSTLTINADNDSSGVGDFSTAAEINIQADSGITITGQNIRLAGSAGFANGKLQSNDTSINLNPIAGIILSGNVRIDTDKDNTGNAGSAFLTASNIFADVAGKTLSIDTNRVNNATGGTIAINALVDDGAAAGLFLGALKLRSQGATDGTISLSQNISVDGGDVTLQGKVVLLNSISIDTEQGNNGSAGSIIFARTDLPEGFITVGNVNSTISSAAAGLTLTLDASTTGGNGGEVALGNFNSDGGNFINKLDVNTDGTANGQIIINENIALSQTTGDGFVSNASGANIISRRDSNTGNVQSITTQGGNILLNNGHIFAESGDTDMQLTLNSTGASATSGAINFGVVDDDSGTDSFLNAFSVFANGTTTVGTISLQGSAISVDGSINLLGNVELNTTTVLDSEQGNNAVAGSVVVGGAIGSSITASAAGFDLTLDTSVAGFAAGSVSLSEVLGNAGVFVNDITIDTNGATNGLIVLAPEGGTASILLDAVGADTGDFTVSTVAEVRIDSNLTIDTEQGADADAGNILFGSSTLFSNAIGNDLILQADSAGNTGGIVIVGLISDNGAAFLNDVTIDVFSVGGTLGNITVFTGINTDSNGADVSDIVLKGRIETPSTISFDNEAGGDETSGDIDLSFGLFSASNTGVDLAFTTATTGSAGDVFLPQLDGAAGNFVNDLTVNTAGAVDGNVIFANDVLLDSNGADLADLTLTGVSTARPTVSLTIDVEQGNDEDSGSIDFSGITLTAIGGGKDLTLSTETSQNSGDIKLGLVTNSPSFINDLTLNSLGGLSSGLIELNGSINIDSSGADDATFTVNGDRVQLNAAVTIDTDNVSALAGDIIFNVAEVFANASGLILTLDTSSGVFGSEGDIILPLLSNDANARTFLGGLVTNSASGTTILNGNVFVEGAITLEGDVKLNASNIILDTDSLAVLSTTGSINLINATISAAGAGTDLSIQTNSAGAAQAGDVFLGAFDNTNGAFVNDVTINVTATVGGKVFIGSNIALDANAADAGDFSVVGAIQGVVTADGLSIDTESGGINPGGAIDFSNATLFSTVSGANFVLDASGGGTNGAISIGVIDDNAGANNFFNDLTITGGLVDITQIIVVANVFTVNATDLLTPGIITSGSINFSSGSSLLVSNTVTTSGDAVFNVVGDLAFTGGTSTIGGDALLTSSGTLTITGATIDANGGVSLTGADVIIDSGGGVIAKTNTLNANTTAIKITASNLAQVGNLVANNVAGLGIDIDPITVDITDNIDATGNIFVVSADDITVASAVSITSSTGNVDLLADLDANGIGAINAIGSVISGDAITLSGAVVNPGTLSPGAGGVIINDTSVAAADPAIDPAQDVPQNDEIFTDTTTDPNIDPNIDPTTGTGFDAGQLNDPPPPDGGGATDPAIDGGGNDPVFADDPALNDPAAGDPAPGDATGNDPAGGEPVADAESDPSLDSGGEPTDPALEGGEPLVDENGEPLLDENGEPLPPERDSESDPAATDEALAEEDPNASEEEPTVAEESEPEPTVKEQPLIAIDDGGDSIACTP